MEQFTSTIKLGSESGWPGYFSGVEEIHVLDANGEFVQTLCPNAVPWVVMWEFPGMVLRLYRRYTTALEAWERGVSPSDRSYTDYQVPSDPPSRVAVVRFRNGDDNTRSVLPVWDKHTLSAIQKSGWELVEVRDNDQWIDCTTHWYNQPGRKTALKIDVWYSNIDQCVNIVPRRWSEGVVPFTHFGTRHIQSSADSIWRSEIEAEVKALQAKIEANPHCEVRQVNYLGKEVQ